jgi:hypothetical protein
MDDHTLMVSISDGLGKRTRYSMEQSLSEMSVEGECAVKRRCTLERPDMSEVNYKMNSPVDNVPVAQTDVNQDIFTHSRKQFEMICV